MVYLPGGGFEHAGVVSRTSLSDLEAEAVVLFDKPDARSGVS
jgi:hypothetical protein